MLINELTGTQYPIIQGGMANIATGAFAASVSNAGALGLVASGGMNAEDLRAKLEWDFIRETDIRPLPIEERHKWNRSMIK